VTGEEVSLQDYSRALDEIYRLRAALAIEAGITESHLDLVTFPKSRRSYAEDQVARMRAAARGDSEQAYGDFDGWAKQSALEQAGASATLTRGQWEAA